MYLETSYAFYRSTSFLFYPCEILPGKFLVVYFKLSSIYLHLWEQTNWGRARLTNITVLVFYSLYKTTRVPIVLVPSLAIRYFPLPLTSLPIGWKIKRHFSVSKTAEGLFIHLFSCSPLLILRINDTPSLFNTIFTARTPNPQISDYYFSN